jgi:hypothetical protein
MGLNSLVSRLKRRTRAEDTVSQSDPISESNGKAILSSSAPEDTEVNLPPQKPATDGRDLWLEAFEKLPRKSQEQLERRGMNRQGSESMVNQVKKFQKEAETQRDRSFTKDWRVQIGGHDIPVRQTTLQIVNWAEKIGDVAIQFALAPGAGGVWAVARSVLEVGSLYREIQGTAYTVWNSGNRYFRQRKERPTFCCRQSGGCHLLRSGLLRDIQPRADGEKGCRG